MPGAVIQSRPLRHSEGGAELVEHIRQFERDSRFLELHHDLLLDQFAEQWVAVFDEQVVAHDTNINSVLRQLGRKKIPQNRVAVEFLTRRRKTLIL